VSARAPIEPTSSFADLVFHVLSHLAVPGHTSLHAPRYVVWARRELDAGAVDPIAEDATVLSALHAAEPHVESLHALPFLHDRIDDMLASAARPLDELRPVDVADAAVLRALRSVDPKLVDILRADIALAGRAYARTFEARIRPLLVRACDALREPFAIACDLMPSLLTARIELAHPLGRRGRVIRDRIVVGAPSVWNDVTPESAIVLAMHERAVSLAQGEWATVERLALREVARRLEHAPTPLAEAHHRWLHTLDLPPLLPEITAQSCCVGDCPLLNMIRE
jgi:hypothetical protein